MKIPNFLLKQQATIYKSMGDGAYGPVYDETPQFSRVYLEPSQKVVKTSTGEEVTTSALAVFPPKTPLTMNSKVVIDSHDYTVISIIPVKGWIDSCVEVLLK